MFLLQEKNKQQKQKIHIIGIGGIGMSAIAKILQSFDFEVQGSDISKNNNVKELMRLNIKCYENHDVNNIDSSIDYIIYSSAIKADNEEILQGKKLNIPIITRAEILGQIIKAKCSISISGAHGKTTTTSLIANLFEANNINPTVLNGGIINNKNSNAYVGDSNYIITEADESDGTFIEIPSEIAIITNIDEEHMDHYKNFDHILKSFELFIKKLPFYGFAVACIDDKNTKSMLSNINTNRKIITYSIDNQDANLIAHNIRVMQNNDGRFGTKFDVKLKMNGSGGVESQINEIKDVFLPMFGKHNVLNSLAAIAVLIELNGVKNTNISNGFASYLGVKRRFTQTAIYNKALIIDDYAHHPKEIASTIDIAYLVKKYQNKNQGKIVAIFQPHRYSRTKHLLHEFNECFDKANIIYITDIYSAGEKPIENINSKELVNIIKQYNIQHNKEIDISYISKDDIKQNILELADENDIFIFMGAGDITHLANSF